MKILLVMMVFAVLVMAIGLCWISFKMLRDTQAQAQREQQEKINKQKSLDK